MTNSNSDLPGYRCKDCTFIINESQPDGSTIHRCRVDPPRHKLPYPELLSQNMIACGKFEPNESSLEALLKEEYEFDSNLIVGGTA